MSWNGTVLLGLFGSAILVVVAWMLFLAARLRSIERAVKSIEVNTNTLRDLVDLLRSVEGNTALLGGIRGVFGSKDHKRAR